MPPFRLVHVSRYYLDGSLVPLDLHDPALTVSVPRVVASNMTPTWTLGEQRAHQLDNRRKKRNEENKQKIAFMRRRVGRSMRRHRIPIIRKDFLPHWHQFLETFFSLWRLSLIKRELFRAPFMYEAGGSLHGPLHHEHRFIHTSPLFYCSFLCVLEVTSSSWMRALQQIDTASFAVDYLFNS